MKRYRVFFCCIIILFLVTPTFGGYVTEKNGKKGFVGYSIKVPAEYGDIIFTNKVVIGVKDSGNDTYKIQSPY